MSHTEYLSDIENPDQWIGRLVSVPHKTQTKTHGTLMWKGMVVGTRIRSKNPGARPYAKVQPLNASSYSMEVWVDPERCEVIA